MWTHFRYSIRFRALFRALFVIRLERKDTAVEKERVGQVARRPSFMSDIMSDIIMSDIMSDIKQGHGKVCVTRLLRVRKTGLADRN